MENTPTTHYLYGASVQGIQGFIFQTNELKDIVGASELVEKICTTAFIEMMNEGLSQNAATFQEDSAIVMAAGNIKYIFDNEELCKKVVLGFPKKVMEMAPGITISQAVVKYGLDMPFTTFKSAVQELENRLRIQRNKPMRSMTLGSIGILRSRKTGLPAIQYDKDEAIDPATSKKRDNAKAGNNATLQLCKKIFGKDIKSDKVAYDINKITDQNNWIAIIHADGNGLGQVVQKVGTNPGLFKKFSVNLDKATTFAAQKAYQRLNLTVKDKERIPIRPVVLNGDDLTMICRADIALDFTSYFLEEFEYATGSEKQSNESNPDSSIKETRKELQNILHSNKVFKDGSTHLSACAGIAYIKSSYPFYYGYELAETLCTEAKREAKTISGGMEKLPPSCLMFHKVQSSFVEEFEQIVQKELTAGTLEKPISFQFGPYYLSEQNTPGLGTRWSIKTLKNTLSLLQNSSAGQAAKNHLRECANLLINNPELAIHKLERLKVLVQDDSELKKLIDQIFQLLKPKKDSSEPQNNSDQSPQPKRIPLYDLLTLYSVQYQITQKK